MTDYVGHERRKNGQKELFKEAMVEALDEFCADEERVQKFVHAVFASIQHEIESSGGKFMFRGVRRLLFGAIVFFLILAFFGSPTAIAWLKGWFVP